MKTNDQIGEITTHFKKGAWRIIQIAFAAGALAGFVLGYNIS